MNDLLKKIIGDLEGKKEWKALEVRAKALPDDYRVAYEEIKHYLWRTAGPTTIKPFAGLLKMFEDGAADGKHVLKVTGDDVAAFVDKLMRDEATYAQEQRQKLNQAITKKLKK